MIPPAPSPFTAFNDFDAYCRLFTDVSFWTPYVETVCRKHGLLPCQSIRVGVPGSYPAFIVDERWVVKFFGRLLEGGESFIVESEAARLFGENPAIGGNPGVRQARVVAQGELGDEDWPWPYLIFEFIHGVSVGEIRDQLSAEDRRHIAREMGQMVRCLHAIPLDGSTVFPNSLQPYRNLLERQRAICVENHRKWQTLPERLIDQIEEFMPPLNELIDTSRPPHLIHADLTRDHLLGRIEEGHWTSLALIDFGDAMTGDFLYELAALYLDLFGVDRTMLAVFLDEYGLPPEMRTALPEKALATALLHRFNVMEGVSQELLSQVSSLKELAHALWA